MLEGPIMKVEEKKKLKSTVVKRARGRKEQSYHSFTSCESNSMKTIVYSLFGTPRIY